MKNNRDYGLVNQWNFTPGHVCHQDVEVEYEFLRVAEDTKMKRPNFVVKHGLVMRAGNTLDDLGKPGIDPFKKKKDPVVILNEHIVVNDLRLVDILQRYDPSGAFSVTPEDFLTALEVSRTLHHQQHLSCNAFATTLTDVSPAINIEAKLLIVISTVMILPDRQGTPLFSILLFFFIFHLLSPSASL